MGRIFEVRKHAMFARWNRMAKQFTRVAKDIAMAVHAGGADPASNPTLRRVLQNARAVNMPKDKTDAEFATDVVGSMHQFLLGAVQELNSAARDLRAAAPSTAGRGWNDSDQEAVASMKKAWIRARMAWEQAEGTLSPLFPALDQSLDGRYDELLAAHADDDLFVGTKPQLGVKFDQIVTAQQARAYKPSLKIFELALTRIGVPAHRILHVGQSIYHDVLPARSLGLATIWVNRPSPRAGVGAVKAADGRPDLQVSSLAELASAILRR